MRADEAGAAGDEVAPAGCEVAPVAVQAVAPVDAAPQVTRGRNAQIAVVQADRDVSTQPAEERREVDRPGTPTPPAYSH
jgi:hypothetical protein